MSYLRVGLLLCAVAVAPLLGCDGGADEAATNESTATSCAIESFDQAWWNQAFPEQTGKFHVELGADVTTPNMDVVVGLSDGAATKWASLAAIVRFNTQGTIDVRDGATYRADVAYTYYANTRYYLRFDVDVRTHRYSVWIKQWGEYSLLARDYAFRTEQAGVTRLTNVAAFINPATSANGSAEVCGFTVVADDTTGNNCLGSTAGGGFVNAVVTPSSTVSFVAFSAKAGQANMDGVVGVASGNVDAYEDFAASIRFFTNGYIEARDGAGYRADRPIAYVAGGSYSFKLMVDLPSHTYSVFVAGPGVDTEFSDDYVRLASGYRFRPSQAGVASVDRIASVVASASGSVDACGIAGGPHPRHNVVSMRDGWFDLATRSDGAIAFADTFRTTLLDANNVPIGSVSTGGQVGADASGNVYTAQVIDGRLYVRAFSPSLAPLWTNSAFTAGRIIDLAAMTPVGTAAISISDGAQYGAKPKYLAFHGAGGQYNLLELPSDTSAIGLGTSHFVLARAAESGYTFETRSYDNPYYTISSRAIPGNYWVTRVAVAPDASFVITGMLGGPMDFGDGEIAPFSHTDGGVYWDQYIAVFAPDLALRFSERLTNTVTGLVTNGRDIAVSYQTWTQLPYTDFRIFNQSGDVLRGSDEDSVVGPWGDSGEIALADSGRMYWNIGAKFVAPHGNGFPFLFTIDP
jgi:hypothetical protein